MILESFWRIVVIHDFRERPFYFLTLGLKQCSNIYIFLKTVFLNYLFVLLYFLLYSVFNEHLRLVLVLINQSISFAHFYLNQGQNRGENFVFSLGKPPAFLVGSNGLEPSTSRLSGARSSHLSYEPM